MSTDGQFKVKQIVPGTQHYVLKSGAAVCEWGLLTNNNIDGSAVIAVSKLAAGSNNQVLATVSSTPTWANLTDAMHGSLSGGTLHAAVSNSAAGFAPAVSATSGAIAYSTGSGLAYSTGATLSGGSKETLTLSTLRITDACAGTGQIRGGTYIAVYGLVGSTDTKLLVLNSGVESIGDPTNVTTLNQSASTTINNYIGANVALAITAAGLTAKVGANTGWALTANNVKLYRDGDATTYSRLLMYADAVQHRVVVSSTDYPYLYASHTGVILGNNTDIPTTSLYASTLVDVYVGSNQAAKFNASGVTFKVGAATGWYLASTGVTIPNQADGTDYLRILSEATQTTFVRVTDGGTAHYGLTLTDTTAKLGSSSVSTTTTVAALTNVLVTIGANAALALTAAGLTAKVGANTGLSLTSAGVFVYNQADVNDYLQIASLDTYSYIYRRTNTGGAQTVFGCSTTAVDLGATTGVATTTLNASTTIASAIGGNRVTSATSDGFRVYNQSAVTKFANMTLDSSGFLMTMAEMASTTEGLNIEIRGGDSEYPTAAGDVILRPGKNDGDEYAKLYLCGYPMAGIEITACAGSTSSVTFTGGQLAFFSGTPTTQPNCDGTLGSVFAALVTLNLVNDTS
jgi:hypothetical protein